MITYEWRGGFDNGVLERLHAEAFEHEEADHDWLGQMQGHSLGWVTARDGDGTLVGFVNVVWDGGGHAFILDTMVAGSDRRQGIATALVGLAADNARRAGCEWLHVDFDHDLSPFYIEACGFEPAPAGLIRLR